MSIPNLKVPVIITACEVGSHKGYPQNLNATSLTTIKVKLVNKWIIKKPIVLENYTKYELIIWFEIFL